MQIYHKTDFPENVEFKTVFSFECKAKNDYLPLVELSKKDYWNLFKKRLRGKLYLFVIPSPRQVNFRYEFIRIKKKRRKLFNWT